MANNSARRQSFHLLAQIVVLLALAHVAPTCASRVLLNRRSSGFRSGGGQEQYVQQYAQRFPEPSGQQWQSSQSSHQRPSQSSYQQASQWNQQEQSQQSDDYQQPEQSDDSQQPQETQQPQATQQPQQQQQGGSSGSDSTSDSVMKSVLDMHNSFRARHGVPALTWSSQVAATAQSYANNCVFSHSGHQGLGENLAQGHSSFTAAVQDWYNEVSSYNYGGDYIPGTGHFTQIVWKGTTQLGCGVAPCSGQPLYVCNYSPAGNMIGDFKNNVFPPGSSGQH